MIVNHDIGASQAAQATDRNESGITGTGADDKNNAHLCSGPSPWRAEQARPLRLNAFHRRLRASGPRENLARAVLNQLRGEFGADAFSLHSRS